MGDAVTGVGRSGVRARRAVAVVAVGVLLVGLGACTSASSSSPQRETKETVPADATHDLLGADDPASGEPVKIGMLSEGSSASIEAGDELRAGQATVDWLNAKRGGIDGRPIELVTCEMKADPSVAQDCANQMIQEGVVAVTVAQASNLDTVWQPLHDAGIPLMVLSGTGQSLLTDSQSTFIMTNPAAAFFGLPIAIAKSTGATKVAFVIIDVPQALDVLKTDDGKTMARAGLQWDAIPVPLGTPDMTSQMQQVKDSGAGVVHILGNDAFCIAAIQGLRAVGYQGAIAGVSQCFTDATTQALGSGLEGVEVLAPLANGATDDPTYQLYLAVMGAYGDAVQDVSNYYAVAGYAAVATLVAAVGGISGDITAATVTQAIKTMPPTPLPAGGGATFQCGGSMVPDQPAICTNQWLRAQLDASGNPTNFTVEDSTQYVG